MHPTLQEYQSKIDEITGTMVRLYSSLYSQRERLKELVKTADVPLTATLTECSYEERADPVHSDTIENQIARLENGGFDEVILGNMSIAYIYSLWEDKYRKDYALAVGLSGKNSVQSEVFSELNKYRRAIVHNGSRGNEETEKLRILPPIKKGVPLQIGRVKFEEIITIIKMELRGGGVKLTP